LPIAFFVGLATLANRRFPRLFASLSHNARVQTSRWRRFSRQAGFRANCGGGIWVLEKAGSFQVCAVRRQLFFAMGMNQAKSELLTLVSALQDHQYNVFVVDFAAHGANAGMTTFGYKEAEELRAAIDTLASRNDVDPRSFGLWDITLAAMRPA